MTLIAIACTLCLQRTSPPENSRIAGILALPIEQREAAASTLLKESKPPLYEDDPENKESTRTTFLWSGNANSVGLIADFAVTWSTQQLTKIEGTDLWYRTYSLPSDCSFYYRLAHSDKAPPLENADNWVYNDEISDGDPLNPLGITIGRTRRFSFAILPHAPKIDAIERKPRAVGTFQPSLHSSFQIESKTLGKHRVWLYKSAGFDPKKACNLIVFLDGSGAFQLMPSITILDNMTSDGVLGQTLAIYTDSPDRSRDLACSDDYLDFLIKDIMGWVSTDNKVKFNAKRTVICGQSLGGLCAAYATFKHPEVFGAALMQSPSLWWHPPHEDSDWLTRQFVTAKKVPGRYFVAPGTFERTAADPTATGILYSSRWFVDVLKARKLPTKFRAVHGGHDPFNWQTSLPDGLVWLLGKGN